MRCDFVYPKVINYHLVKSKKTSPKDVMINGRACFFIHTINPYLNYTSYYLPVHQ